ncbi:TonB-dependent receptor plug domain-containing protein [Bacteroides thetaiotaomicron]|nr:TonB-dependent receptor plug domain-containing protein [Bacteroides thetaiotaomicron]
MLGGRLPGISSVEVSGEPGDEAVLRVSMVSIYNVTYIVDGSVPRSINDIDPNDIESLSVLKDGASAAVYGLKGAGGVIIVTTKRGQEGKSRITYNGSIGASMNANFPQFMNGPQFAYYYNMADMMDKLANGSITDMKQYTPVFTKANVKRC